MPSWGEEDVSQTDTGFELSDIALEEIMSESFGEVSQTMSQITWGYLRDWASQNNVPDDAVVGDEDTGELAVDLSFNPADPSVDEPATLSIQFDDVNE
jgi:hypothetical protein